MKEPITKWDKETGIATYILYDADGNVHEGNAFCHEDDEDMMNEYTGLYIARCRAEISAYKAYKYKLKNELGALNQLYYSMKHSSNFNEKSYENYMLQRQIELKKEDIETVKNIIEQEKVKLKIYIAEKDALYKQFRILRNKKQS